MSSNDVVPFEFDANSVAGQRVNRVRRLKSNIMWELYGMGAFALVTDDQSAIGLGLAALRKKRSTAEVAEGLARYLYHQEQRQKAEAAGKKKRAAPSRKPIQKKGKA